MHKGKATSAFPNSFLPGKCPSTKMPRATLGVPPRLRGREYACCSTCGLPPLPLRPSSLKYRGLPSFVPNAAVVESLAPTLGLGRPHLSTQRDRNRNSFCCCCCCCCCCRCPCMEPGICSSPPVSQPRRSAALSHWGPAPQWRRSIAPAKKKISMPPLGHKGIN